MSAQEVNAPDFACFRGYLWMRAKVAIGPRWDRRFDASDIVQETLLQAHQRRSELRGTTGAAVRAWLRAILDHNLDHAMRDHRRERRDIGKEIPIDEVVQKSTARFGAALGIDTSTPSGKAQREECVMKLYRSNRCKSSPGICRSAPVAIATAGRVTDPLKLARKELA